MMQFFVKHSSPASFSDYHRGGVSERGFTRPHMRTWTRVCRSKDFPEADLQFGGVAIYYDSSFTSVAIFFCIDNCVRC